MSDIGKIRHHAALFDRVAGRAGVDLQDAAIAGALPYDGIADAVLRCMDCPLPEACQVWLEEPAGADIAPEFCVNREIVSELRGQAS
ncbi:DUF6455 family protein [Thiosulfatihalobacter marinus]|uniref:DUF6455 family protein n=1 Tax=Thiosulfatihalobacter marinus TaxID=2792481 RepID=UPI0018D83458|nr:DUF6455 family protein [Thiosulfatihalobacter marinus]